MTLRCHHCGAATPYALPLPHLSLAADPLPRRGDRAPRGRRPGALSASPRRPARPRRRRAPRRRPRAGRRRVHAGATSTSSSARASWTKGLDVPEVTLVGVVSADVALNLPDERAAERTYQLLAQAVGRAGRGERPGHGVIQTYQPGHPAIRAVVEGRRGDFYDAELALRDRFGSPPFGRLVKLTVGLLDRDAAEAGRRRWPTVCGRGPRRRRARRGRRSGAGVRGPTR